MHSQEKLFEIAKKFLIFSGKKGKITAAEKKKIIPQLTGILEQIHTDESPMSIKIQRFIKDILGDIENDRSIDIDGIDEDSYIENYILSERFVANYNSFLTSHNYKQIVTSIQTYKQKETSIYLKKQKTQINKIIKSFDVGNISRVLLITDIFRISAVQKYYKQLYITSLQYNDADSANTLLEIINTIHSFHTTLHKAGLKCIQNNTVETQYMLCDIKNNKLSFSPIKVCGEGKKNILYIKLLIEKFSI